MFEKLDIVISIAVIFLILSMVLKYWLSVIKRCTNIKAATISGEMATFVGENTTRYLIPYLERRAKFLNFLDERKKLGLGKISRQNGLRLLSGHQLTEVVGDLSEFLQGKSAKDIREQLGLEIPENKIDEGIGEIKTHLENLKNRIERNYDNTMQKISEVYEGKMRKQVFIWGLVFAFLINADFFDIYGSLSKNPAARDRLVSRVEEVNRQIDLFSSQMDTDEKKEIQESLMTSASKMKNKMNRLINELDEADLALGWTWNGLREFISKLTALQSIPSFFKKIFGIFISGLLISFGAPFWHDFLATFTSINKKLRG